MKRALLLGCTLAWLAAPRAHAAEIAWTDVPALGFPAWPSAAPADTQPINDVALVRVADGMRLESDRCLTVPDGARRDQVTSLEVPATTRILRSERLIRRGAQAFLVVEHLFLEHGRARIRGDGPRELPLQPIAVGPGIEIFAFRDDAAVHVVVPVEAQMVFRDAIGSGECVCSHLHLALPIADGEPPLGATALASGAIGIDDPSTPPRVLTVAASVSRVTRDHAPRLSLTTSVRSMLGRGARPCANEPSCSQ